MTAVQSHARAVLARIAQKHSAANAALAGGAQLRAQITALRARPVAEIRAEALARLEDAKQAFARATGVDWYAGLAVRYANYERWRPYQTILDDAAESFAQGASATTDEEKKTRYVRSWVSAGQVLAEVQTEGRAGKTDLTMVLKAGAEKAADEIAGFDWSPLYWVCGGLMAMELLRK